MKVLLTGGGGFMGHHALLYLLKNTDWEFVLTDSFNHVGISARLRAVFDEIPNERKRVKIITHDLTTPIDKVTASEFGKIDVIINTASLANVDESIKEPPSFIKNNINLSINMFEYARNLDSLKTFIQVSTDEVFGDANNGLNHHEWSPLTPSNPYSASKVGQEAIAQAYWRTFNVPIVITNTTNMFGERQDQKAFIPKVINHLMNDKVIPVHGKYFDGKFKASSRFYLYTQNQVDAIKFLIEKFINTSHRYSDGLYRIEKFNVAGDIEVYNDEIVLKVANILDIKKEGLFEYVDPTIHRPGLDLRYSLDGSKLKNAGWKQPFSFDQALEKTVLWTKDNPVWL
jgi:dTDP-glucose 4,6-dehydratase